MMVDGDAGGDEKSTFRWLDAVRYAVAAVVTVLIVAVIANAIKVVLRPDSLSLSVTGGFVFARPRPAPTKVVTLGVNLRAQNPSGRVRMYYVDIDVYLFDGNTSASASTDPEDDSITYFRQPEDIAVAQLEAVDSILQVEATNETMPESFELLYNGGGMSDVTLRLDGRLVTEVTSGINRTGRPTTYYCGPLVVGGGDTDDDEAVKNRQDVSCSDVQGSSSKLIITMSCIVSSWLHSRLC
uniref:Late embryogenesis abundant protein LEA-2 subgroup domain-containing protein n=1 Tax=Arundo donax TaxID=35708 RepID=A0A0A9EC90_ARUDO